MRAPDNTTTVEQTVGSNPERKERARVNRRREVIQERARARVKRRREADRRVRAYEKWLQAGSPANSVPELPTDHDYKLARGER